MIFKNSRVTVNVLCSDKDAFICEQVWCTFTRYMDKYPIYVHLFVY